MNFSSFSQSWEFLSDAIIDCLSTPTEDKWCMMTGTRLKHYHPFAWPLSFLMSIMQMSSELELFWWERICHLGCIAPIHLAGWTCVSAVERVTENKSIAVQLLLGWRRVRSQLGSEQKLLIYHRTDPKHLFIHCKNRSVLTKKVGVQASLQFVVDSLKIQAEVIYQNKTSFQLK